MRETPRVQKYSLEECESECEYESARQNEHSFESTCDSTSCLTLSFSLLSVVHARTSFSRLHTRWKNRSRDRTRRAVSRKLSEIPHHVLNGCRISFPTSLSNISLFWVSLSLSLSFSRQEQDIPESAVLDKKRSSFLLILLIRLRYFDLYTVMFIPVLCSIYSSFWWNFLLSHSLQLLLSTLLFRQQKVLKKKEPTRRMLSTRKVIVTKTCNILSSRFWLKW